MILAILTKVKNILNLIQSGTHQSNLERYLAARRPENAAEADYLIRQYNLNNFQ